MRVRGCVRVVWFSSCIAFGCTSGSPRGVTTGTGQAAPAAGATTQSPPAAGVPASAGTSGVAGTALAAGRGGAAGAAIGGVGGSRPEAGVGAAGSSAAGAAAPACKIPNEILLIDDDADGGLAPECQNVPRKVIANNCIGGICHDSKGPPSGGLDLMAPCVADRLVNVKSRCQDLLYIDTEHPEHSFLFDKINNLAPTCGVSMPDRGQMPPDELSCMNAWINAVIRAAKAQ